MSDKPVLVPGPDHPITVQPTSGTVTVTVGDHVVATSSAGLTLEEAGHPPVHYVPLADVDAALLEPTDHATYCPYKGDASYYDLRVDGGTAANAVWTYTAPFAAVGAIKDHVAFTPGTATVSVASAAG